MDERTDPASRVRPLSATHLSAAASLHRSELTAGLFPRLGVPFLSRYLDTYRAHPTAIALEVVNDDELSGFLVGTTEPGHSRWALRERWRALLPAALLGVLLHPAALVLLLRSRVGRYVRGTRAALTGAPEPATADVPALLMHVAVRPASRGSGDGRALVTAFEAAARERGRTRALLVTHDSDGAGSFYTRLGWELVRSRPDGAHVYERQL